MPAWIHNRAEHLLAKNPSMNKSTAFAIATQQSHATGKTPKGYGTAEGKSEAKAKYDKPKKEYKKTPNPGKLNSPKLAMEDPVVMRVEVSPGSVEFLKPLLERLQEVGGVGHSFSVIEKDPPDGKEVHIGSWDGDGSCRIGKITVEKPGSLQSKTSSASFGRLKSAMPGAGWLKGGMSFKPGGWRSQAGFTPTGMKTPAQRLQKSMKMGKFDANKGLKPLTAKIGSINSRRLEVKPMTKTVSAEVPNSAFKVKAGFATSQYSGPLNPERMKYHSYLPPFSQPPVKTAGPPPSGKLKKASTPAAMLSKAKQVGAPRATPMPGPSIAQISKPVGFGKPLAGATKT
jgi:hypothetical protein